MLKYSTAIVIDLPRPRVVELFTDTDNIPAWQPGLEKFELLEGEPGQPGAKTRLVFRRDRREIDLIETIVSQALPDELTVRYETEGVKNLVVNRFEALEDSRTRWVAENEFKFAGWMLFLGLFLGAVFRKQTLDDMRHFKAFAENA